MKIFIFQYLDGLTDNYHHGGGAVVIAESLERARELLNDAAPDDDDERTGYHTVMPDSFYDVAAMEEKVFIFPDSGCC